MVRSGIVNGVDGGAVDGMISYFRRVWIFVLVPYQLRFLKLHDGLAQPEYRNISIHRERSPVGL